MLAPINSQGRCYVMSSRHNTMSSRRLDRFLFEFVNYGWREAGLDRMRAPGSLLAATEFESLEREHRTIQLGRLWFRQRNLNEMLPQPAGTAGNRVMDEALNFIIWQNWLRSAWTERSEAVRKNTLLTALAFRCAAMQKSDGLFINDFNRIVTPMARGDFRTGFWPDGFLQALRRAIEIAPDMRRCGNPDCPRPFFLAKRTTSKYCSLKCGLPAKRTSKARYWEKHKQKYLNARKLQRRVAQKRKLQSRKEK